MKNLLIASAGLILCATSCINDEKDYSVNPETRIASCETSQDFTVPIRKGYTTYITLEEDTLAVANEPITLRIPKEYASELTRAEGDKINISYDVLKEGAQETYSKAWQAVMFEDTPNGDYDYNDLIIHVRNIASNHPYQHPDETWQTIEIQPIALGSNKEIGLGCLLSDGSEHIISTDVRKELFGGKQGFINTVNDQDPVRYKLAATNLTNHAFPKSEIKAAWIAWFIEVEGQRFYAVSSDLDYRKYDMVNKANMPYGLVVAGNNGTFNYPQEKTSLFEAYPGFNDWINGKSSSIGSFNKASIYTYCFNNLPGGHKIWDYLDLVSKDNN